MPSGGSHIYEALREVIGNIMERIHKLETQEPDKLTLTEYPVLENTVLDDDVWMYPLGIDNIVLDQQGTYLVHLIIVTTDASTTYMQIGDVLYPNYVVYPPQSYQLWPIIVPPLGSVTIKFRVLSSVVTPNYVAMDLSRVLVQKISA